ncbi:MAG TPA: hypothetical protein VFG00_13690 [Acidothermaceae bacterium]|nr:hypothetical protein [Acidothermaceae bacterium]
MARRRKVVAAVALSGLGAELAVLSRRRGYVLGTNTVVRCRNGHLFTTIWIPGVSLKSVRLGWWRYQKCPVGNHWTFVTPMKMSELTEEELQRAAEHRDVRIP